MPNAVFAADRMRAWGAAVLRIGEELYVYGTDERRGNGPPDRRMVVARVPAASVGTFAAWRYFRDGVWGEDFRNASPLAGDIASDYSVTLSGSVRRHLHRTGLVIADHGSDGRPPVGPWSAPAVLYDCPEMSRDAKVFCYGAKRTLACRRARTGL